MNILINENQLEFIQKNLVKKSDFELAEQNWKNLSNEEKNSIVEIYKEIYPKKGSLLVEGKWYNTLLDFVGIVDPTGIVDFGNGISYISQGGPENILLGFLSIVSALPYAGDVVAKPVMGLLKIGSPSVKGLIEVLKLVKAGKQADAAIELAKISHSGGSTGKLVKWIGTALNKLRLVFERLPIPKGVKKTVSEWFNLFEKSAVRGTKLRGLSADFAGKMVNVSKQTQINRIENLIKLSKRDGVFMNYRTGKEGIFSWKTLFGGMPQLLGKNRSVRALVRKTKFWYGFLTHFSFLKYLTPDEVIKKIGPQEFESKVMEYQNTEEGKQYFNDSFGGEEQFNQYQQSVGQQNTPQQNTPQQTYTQQSSTKEDNPFSTFFQMALS
jgi:hypothetical protein